MGHLRLALRDLAIALFVRESGRLGLVQLEQVGDKLGPLLAREAFGRRASKLESEFRRAASRRTPHGDDADRVRALVSLEVQMVLTARHQDPP